MAKCKSGCECRRHTNSGNPYPVGTAGIEPWNKGKTGVYSEEALISMSLSKRELVESGWRPVGMKGRKQTAAHTEKIRDKLQGISRSPEFRKRVSEGKKEKPYTRTVPHEVSHINAIYPRGPRHGNYRGKVLTYFSSGSAVLREWRQKVFERDNWTCQICEVRGGVELNADHIVSKWADLRLVFTVANGRTLCRPCHIKTETFAGKAPRRPKEFQLPLPVVIL